MIGLPDWVPPDVDTKRANTARVYDYWLGGTHNFLADQDLARRIAAVEPNTRAGVRANRAFLGRAVRFMAAAGVTQFLDIGSGIPTEGNVHEIAQEASPGARVVTPTSTPSRSRTAGPFWPAIPTPRSSRPTCSSPTGSWPTRPPAG
jgi:S-adenosyl methyltransferase